MKEIVVIEEKRKLTGINLDRFMENLVSREGYRQKPYLCSSGKLTIGIGTNLDDVGVTLEEAKYLASNQVFRCADEIIRHLPWADDLPTVAQETLLDMCYNMGINRLMGFKKALAAMKVGEWHTAAEEMLDSRWARQVGDRAKSLAAQIKKLKSES